jgi:uncharacterized OB-fold protein
MTAHLPLVDADSKPFWDALERGALVLPECVACRRVHYYPRLLCPFCWEPVQWLELSGRGEVFATTVVRRIGLEPFRDRTPYDLSLVELEEGPRLLTNVVGTDPDRVAIGCAVELCPTLDGDRWMPTFRLKEQ